ncbi:MAG: Trm112 family protein [Candidatus Acidiferrum sp.]
MAIPKELLEILACPICKTPVKLTAENTGLKCGTCHRVYPVRDDIPVMLVEEAKMEEAK